MSFSLVPKTTTPSILSGGAGDAKTTQIKPLFGAVPSPAPTFSLTTTSAVTATTTTSTSTPLSGFTGFNVPSTGVSLGFSTPSTSTTPFSANTGNLNISTTTTSFPSAPKVSTDSVLPGNGILNYNQLEDAINKWTIDLEEQEKLFSNQAKQLNAWDRLLISNGEKVLQLSSNIERVKQQQEQLDQELDFILAQQKELESCIVPLEKELQDIPLQDTDRNETYQLAENLDSQLKQMSEDLKEVIEHLNESAKCPEISDPTVQISRILNAHMDSLQWIDRNTAQISEQLNQIAKMHEYTRHII